MAISIPQINLFLNKFLAIELTLIQLGIDTIFSGVRSGIMQMVIELNANSDGSSPHSSLPFWPYYDLDSNFPQWGDTANLQRLSE